MAFMGGKSAGARKAFKHNVPLDEYIAKSGEYDKQALREAGDPYASQRAISSWRLGVAKKAMGAEFKRRGVKMEIGRRGGMRGVRAVREYEDLRGIDDAYEAVRNFDDALAAELPDPSPFSYHNTWEGEPLYHGATPSDFYRAMEMRSSFAPNNPLIRSELLGLADWDAVYDEALHGWLSKTLKKAKRSIKKRARKVEKAVSKTRKRVVKEAKRGVRKYGVEAAAIGTGILVGPQAGISVFKTLAPFRDAYLYDRARRHGQPPPEIIDYDEILDETEAMAPPSTDAVANEPVAPATPPTPTTVPTVTMLRPPYAAIPSSAMSMRPGPTFVQAAGGFALPPGMPDEMAVTDAGGYGVLAEEDWSAPLPGWGQGSYIPTPPSYVFPDAPAVEPFSVVAGDGGPVFPGFGMGYGTMTWESAESQWDAAGGFGLGDDSMHPNDYY